MTPLTILYVDDDEDIRTIVQLALSLDPAVTAIVAASGSEALALIARGVIPDVAVLDVMMPQVDGPALLERLKTTAARDVPVVFMTARAQASDIERYHGLGAIGVILKPFDPIQLAAEIRTLVAAHSARGTASDR